MSGRALLLVLGVAVFGAFWLQRARSPFLSIEHQTAVTARVADGSGLSAVEAMALREVCGIDMSEDELLTRARALVAARVRFGDQDLAVLTASGHGDLAERLFAEAGGDGALAALALRPLPEAIVAVRFRAMVERFASRRHD